MTVRYEYNISTLKNAAKEKVEKYEHLHKEIQELTNATEINFIGFPLGARGKWFSKNFELLSALGLSKSRQMRTARAMACRALFSSVDMVHIFARKSRTVVNI